ncbi:MAG: hypothetical protein OXH19_13990 [Chloroflexi bacterium]|nr:hypothetical protein [Chloroflexota bacterium]MCY3587482.1 hypothetical protein [Chloroflexota bacterium]MCY3685513.1 hypothetical protein [Chloroflexota bacterium]MDE2708415.1 hypothetical protein [Chloroflexota bacterium]
MGLFEGLRRKLSALNEVREASQAEAATLADVATVRRALLAESQRLGRRERISVTMLMEHSDEDLRTVDLFQIIGHLDAEGEIRNVEQDSFGNLKFDLGTLRNRPNFDS